MLGTGRGRYTWIWQAYRTNSGEQDVSMGLMALPCCVKTFKITSRMTLRGCATDTQDGKTHVRMCPSMCVSSFTCSGIRGYDYPRGRNPCRAAFTYAVIGCAVRRGHWCEGYR
jgi:hypothetical protein